MSTATTPLEHASAVAGKAMKHQHYKNHDFGTPEYTTKQQEVAYGYQIDEKGKKEAVVLNVDEAQQLEKEGKFEGTVVTTKINLPVNFAAVLAYADKDYTEKNEKGEVVARDLNDVLNDLVTLMRPGFQTKAINRRNQKLLDTDENKNFTFSDKDLTADGILDLTDEITSPSKRIFLTEEQKTWKSLSALPTAVREQMWRVYLTSVNKEFYIPASE